jgi:hypothetical protein
MATITYIKYRCTRSDCSEPSSPVTLIYKDENDRVVTYTPVELEDEVCVEWRIRLGEGMTERYPGMLLESCHHYVPYNHFQGLEVPVRIFFLFSLPVL